jgi:hypothetical protein
MPDQAQRFLAEYGSLSHADKLRLEKCAEVNSFETGISGSELFIDAISRIKVGGRHWPPDVKLVPFLRNVIRSVGSARRKRHNRIISDGNFSYRPGGARAGYTVVSLDALPSSELSPEEVLIRIDTKRLIRSLFDRRPVEAVLIERMFEGLRGAELQGDLPDSVFKNAYKQIMRTIHRYRRQ